MPYSNPDDTGSVKSSGASCADCGSPALDRFDDLDDLSRSVWLCLRCVKARYNTLLRVRHVEVER